MRKMQLHAAAPAQPAQEGFLRPRPPLFTTTGPFPQFHVLLAPRKGLKT